jgi:hypothetical protein
MTDSDTTTDAEPLRWVQWATSEHTYGAWKVHKEHYADGVTLFDWIVTHRAGIHWTLPRRRDARRVVEAAHAVCGNDPVRLALLAELATPETLDGVDIASAIDAVALAYTTDRDPDSDTVRRPIS